jgi:hypothetical protein
MVSYYYYSRCRERPFDGSLSEFIRDSALGLPGWFRHYNSWKSRWFLLIKYEDILEDPLHEFTRLLEGIGVSCPKHVVERAIEESTIQNVRRTELRAEGHKTRNLLHTRDGRTGQWLGRFTEDDLKLYERLANKFQFSLATPLD